MKRTWAKLLCAASAVLLCGMQEPPLAQFQRLNAAARAAREAGDGEAYLRHARALSAFVPGNPSVRYAVARGLAMNGQGAASVAELNILADAGFAYPAADEPFFASLRGERSFDEVTRRLSANMAISGTAVSLPIPSPLRGEGVAWSDTRRSLMVGAPGGVYAIDLNDRSNASSVGRWNGNMIGIRPDPRDGSLLACAGDDEGETSVVLKYRPDDGVLMAMYPLPAGGALCNDIALLPDGSFALTDSNNSVVYRFSGSRLEAMTLGRPIFLSNGIAADSEKNRLFVAHAGGVVVQDLATGAAWEMATPGSLVGGIDGMVWHEGALIGVQNLSVPPRLLRIRPDPEARTAQVDVLLSSTEHLAGSTTVAVSGNEAFVFSRALAPDGSEGEPILVKVPL